MNADRLRELLHLAIIALAFATSVSVVALCCVLVRHYWHRHYVEGKYSKRTRPSK